VTILQFTAPLVKNALEYISLYAYLLTKLYVSFSELKLPAGNL